MYCCWACRWAHEGDYLIHSSGCALGHSLECDVRAGQVRAITEKEQVGE